MQKEFDYIVIGSGPAGCAFVRSILETSKDLSEAEPTIGLLEEAAEVRNRLLCAAILLSPG